MSIHQSSNLSAHQLPSHAGNLNMAATLCPSLPAPVNQPNNEDKVLLFLIGQIIMASVLIKWSPDKTYICEMHMFLPSNATACVDTLMMWMAVLLQ